MMCCVILLNIEDEWDQNLSFIWWNKCSKLEKRFNLWSIYGKHIGIREFPSSPQFESGFGETLVGQKILEHLMK
jgi:hypothetical protein